MSRIQFFILRLCLLLTVSVVTVSCTLIGSVFRQNDAVEGIVVDKATGAPIAGAFVSLWHVTMVSDFPHTFTESPDCYWSAIAVTDAQGRYWFPPLAAEPWKALFGRSLDLYLTVYAPNYFYEGQKNIFWTNPDVQELDNDGNILKMQRETRSSTERVVYLNSKAMTVDCAGSRDMSMSGEADLYLTIYEEAKRLANSEADRKVVIRICERAMGYGPVSGDFYPEFFPEPCTFDAERLRLYRETDAREQRGHVAYKKYAEEMYKRNPIKPAE